MPHCARHIPPVAQWTASGGQLGPHAQTVHVGPVNEPATAEACPAAPDVRKVDHGTDAREQMMDSGCVASGDVLLKRDWCEESGCLCLNTTPFTFLCKRKKSI